MIQDENGVIISKHDHNIAGLDTFSYCAFNSASEPLMEMHSHENCIELAVVIKGNETYCIEDETFSLVGGDVIITYANQLHKSGDVKQDVCETFFIIIDPFVKAHFLGLDKESGNQLRTTLLGLDRHLFKADSECLSLLKKAYKSLLKQDKMNRLYAQSMFVGFLSKLLYSQDSVAKEDETISQIVQYIDSNIFENISNDEICSKFGISPTGFRTKFKAIMGMTPNYYINNKKIQIAKGLLKDGNSVTATAMKLSFNTSEYFSAVFKKFTGENPSKF